MSMASQPSALLPARRAPLLYLGFAHVCLLAALVLLAVRPELGAFYYHPRLVAVVHLVTLGFITSAILGALYFVCPLAFRTPLPETRSDLVAFGAWAISVSGVAAHFWIERYAGLAWAGGLALGVALWLGGRVAVGLMRAPVPFLGALPILLAFVNLGLAGGLGVLLGIHKHVPILPLPQLAGVHAHLHLAAVGFATMMVVGAGYRILPMVLPSAMPAGRVALTSACVLEAGVLGLGASLAAGSRLVPWFTLATLAGLVLFLSRIGFMLRHRRPAPTQRLHPDWSVLHVLHSLACLAAAMILGLYLGIADASSSTLRAALAYGVLGLLGFLSQMVIGVEARLLPLAAWLHGFAASGHRELPASQHTAAPHALQGAIFVAWAAGVPGLVTGLWLEWSMLSRVAAATLALGVLASMTAAAMALLRLRPAHGAG